MRLGALKDDAMEAAKLGVGATAVIAASDLLQSRLLVSGGSPLIPAMWAPAVNALFGAVVGNYVKRKFDRDVGVGMIAGGVGSAIAAVLKMVMDPATMAAVQADQKGLLGFGFGFGRAFANKRGVGGYRRLAGTRRPALYGVGTPNMRAAGMFGGATVAIEESGRRGVAGMRGGMRGATVQYEPVNQFAGILS